MDRGANGISDVSHHTGCGFLVGLSNLKGHADGFISLLVLVGRALLVKNLLK